MAIRPILIDQHSPFVEESCALCKEPFQPGQEIVVCPEDATRHHIECWQANGNKCTAYGCTGRGELIIRPVHEEVDEVIEPEAVVVSGRQAYGRSQRGQPPIGSTTYTRPGTKVRALPSRSFSCAQACLFLFITLTILLGALSCFGLYALTQAIITG